MRHIFINLICVASILSACNSAEELGSNPELLGNGEAMIRVVLKSSGAPATYAGNAGYGTHGAFPAENEVKSIAFFAKVGDNEELKHYMSTEADGSDEGLLDGLIVKDAPTGQYEARFKLKDVNANQIPVDFYVIANYDENGIDLTQIVNEEDLENIAKAATVAKSDNPSLPLVMSGMAGRVIDNGQSLTIDFKLRRLVARIDVVNKAVDDGFKLYSARILNGKTRSYFLPDRLPDYVNAIEVAHFPTAKIPQAGATRIDSLYTYENMNGVAATATKVEIKGSYKNTPFHREVSFTKQDEAGADTVLSILRNNLYTIYIRPNADSLSVSFVVTATDWAAADTFNIWPTFRKPILSSFDASALTAAGMKWDEATKTIDITNATAEADFTFTATGNQGSQIAFKHYRGTASTKEGTTGTAWMDGRFTSGPLQGDASTLFSQVHTLTLPDLTGTTPSDMYVLVQNVSKIGVCDTLIIKYRPNYEGTTIKPVLLGGLFWAPVNMGATAIPESVGGWSRATCGYHYQWGRNKGFDYGATNNAGGPVNYSDVQNANGEPIGGNQDKFITSTPPYDWLKSSDIAGQAIRNAIWNPEVNHGPCPAGWRVPTKEELQKIVIAAGGNGNTNGIIKIPGDEPEINLVLPAAGYRNNQGPGYNIGKNGYIWASTYNSGSKQPHNLSFAATMGGVGTYSAGDAFSVRCVQE